MSRLIRVFEHEKLTIHSLCSEQYLLGQKIIDKLWSYNDSNKNIYFEGIRNGVKFKNYVGVIQIGNVTIEILPKADKKQSSDVERGQWHTILLGMLKHCQRIKVDAVSEASLKKRYHSLLDLYFELFLQEVSQLLNQGLNKKYRFQKGNVQVLKGQLNFSKNIQLNVVRRDRFYTQHQVYDHEHLINQILFKALLVLKKISNNSHLIDSVERILSRFPEIQEKNITKHDFDNLILNRKTNQYQEALKIAKMILLNYSPDIKGGNENMLALLFDMNKLWEEYVFRMLSRVKEEGLKVSFQNRTKFWEDKIIKPDLVVKRTIGGIEETFIIDTKWKIIDPKKPGDDDLKQMYAYNMYWGSTKSMLLYPSSDPQETAFGKFHKGREEENLCKLGFVKVMNKGELDKNLGQNVLNLLK